MQASASPLTIAGGVREALLGCRLGALRNCAPSAPMAGASVRPLGFTVRGRMKRAASVGVVAIALAACVLMIFVYWVKWGERQFAVMRVKAAHSQPVRAWRCHDVARPSLSPVGSNSWTLDYSWVGGMGVGDVWLNLKGRRHGDCARQRARGGGDQQCLPPQS